MASINDEEQFEKYLAERNALVEKTRSVQKIEKLELLSDLTKEITMVDGYAYTQMTMAALIFLTEKKNHLNVTNVFPIPDGDTGNNMCICLKNPVKTLFLDPPKSIVQASRNFAADVLIYGQGNSGTILSHFYISLSREIGKLGKDEITVEEYAAAISAAGVSMQNAVSNMVEGTMCSVARDCCQNVDCTGKTLESFVTNWYAKAAEELAKTPDQLQVDGKFILKEAGVVDSGAAGFVFIIEGILKAIKGELKMDDPSIIMAVKLGSEDLDEKLTKDVEHIVEGSKFQFCTEAVVQLKDGVTKVDIEKAFQTEIDANELGDSFVAVQAPSKTGGDMCKIHVHTNNPEKVFEIAGTFSNDEKRPGRVFKEKVEDMFLEYELEHGKALYDMSNAKFVIACDGLVPIGHHRYINLLEAYIIPKSTGEPVVVSDYDNFPPLPIYQKLRNEPERVFTAAATPITYKFALKKALSENPGKDVLALTLAGWGSAFTRNCFAALKMCTEEEQKRITMWDSGYIGCESAQMVMEGLRCAEAGMTKDEAIARMNYVDKRAYHMFWSASESVVQLAKTGRIKSLGDGSQIKPGQTFITGCLPDNVGEPRDNPPKSMWKVAAFFAVIAEAEAGQEAKDQMTKETFEKMAELTKGKFIKNVCISSIGRPDYAHNLAKQMKELIPNISGEIYVHDPNTLLAAASVWGECQMHYWVDDVE